MTGSRGGLARTPGVGSAGLGVLVGLAVSLQPAIALLSVVCVGVAFLGAAQPWLLVVGMWAGILFDRIGATGMDVGRLPVTASKLSVVAGVALWAVHAAVSGARPVRWHPVLGAMVGMVATMAFCIAWAGSIEVGQFDLAGLAMMTVMVALVYAVLREAPLRPLYRVLGLGLVLVLLSSLRSAGAVPAGARASGTMGDPNEWATTVLLVGPFVLGGLADDPGRGVGPLRMALLLLVPAAVLASGSRSALVVGALIAPACLYLLRRRFRELVLCAAVAAAGAPLVLDVEVAMSRFGLLMQRLFGGGSAEDASFTERTELLHQGVQLFYDHWFIGAGPGMFPIATGFVSQAGTLRPAHNTYLQIASEQGVVGLVPLAIFLVTVMATLRRGFVGARDAEGRSRVLGIAVGLAALALMAATLGLLTFAMAWLVLGIGLAVVGQATDARVVAR
ncbi:MAG: O-antigen ligase family protein [Pseudomonadota bacterium]|nr:O-antigen ligase family protein [Pseudomonadota bacterium]